MSTGEGMLFRLVQRKVHILGQAPAALWLKYLFIFMLVLLVLSMAPCLVWRDFFRSNARIVLAFCYMVAFTAACVIATRAMLRAATFAEVVVAKTVPDVNK